jgi:hypothetical protein
LGEKKLDLEEAKGEGRSIRGGMMALLPSCRLVLDE